VTRGGIVLRKLRIVLALLLGAPLAAAVVPASTGQAGVVEEPLPIVFVHGFSGSGAQYETAAKRFASNGFPAERIVAFEYGATPSSALDGFIDAVRTEFGVDQVNVAAHSLGTGVMASYLGNATRAAKVAKYVALDGFPSCGTGVDCISIAAAPLGQSHVEVVSSPESFARQYEHFLGAPPATTDILPEPDPQIAGRAVNFPANSGTDGATLELWEVDAATGARTTAAPVAVFDIGASGDWGPVTVDGDARYELNLARDGFNDLHYYFQPFLRTDLLVRLNAAPAGAGSILNTNRSDRHTAAVVVRYREWWSNHASGNNDILQISTASPSAGDEPPADVLTNVATNNVIGIHVHDGAATPEQTTLALLPYFPTQPFQTGVDVFMPAATPPDGVVSFVNAPRGDTSRLQVINVPNWPSSTDAVLVQFSDGVQAADAVGYVVQLPAQMCATLDRIAAAGGHGSSAGLVGVAVGALRALAEAGGAVPIPNLPPDTGPCRILTVWPPGEVDALADAAADWGLTTEQLHHFAARLILYLVYVERHAQA
jgi:pimeloyl-ACP methyl ester carboxylesterase